MIKKAIITVSWLTVLATMVIIFCFSQENMEKSAQTSSSVTEEILEIVLPKEEVTPQKVAEFHPTMRTIAHFGIFMLLGFCLANAFRATLKIKPIFNYILAIIASILYAIIDEIHQKFTGRAPEVKDVLIDSLGAMIGAMLFVAIFYLLKRLLKNKNPS